MEENLRFPDLLRLIDERSTAFRAVVAAAPGLDAQVPTCPGWTLFDLVKHLGGGDRFWAAIVGAGPADAPPARPSPRAPALEVPQEREALLAWLDASTQLLLGALRAAGPESGCWTWWPASQSPQTGSVRGTARHRVQETAVQTLTTPSWPGGAQLLPVELALDGVEEFLFTVCATPSAWPHKPTAFDFHAAEGRSWRLTVDGGDGDDHPHPRAHRRDRAGLGRSRASVMDASELVLYLYDRIQADSLHVDGDAGLLDLLRAWEPEEEVGRSGRGISHTWPSCRRSTLIVASSSSKATTMPPWSALSIFPHGDRCRRRRSPRRTPLRQTWRGNAWYALEEGALDAARLARGGAYADRGHVDAITVTPGLVLAYVHGSRPRPYRVQVRLRTLDDGDGVASHAAAERPGHIAALLDKEMPKSLADCGADLLPGPGDLAPQCSCPDHGHPCKHAAALCYQTARLLDEDPFVLLLLRGRGERELPDALSRRNATRAARAAQEQQSAPLPGVRARDALARRALPPLPAPPPAPAHPEQPPIYPGAPGGPDPFALDQLATDAARAHALLTTGPTRSRS